MKIASIKKGQKRNRSNKFRSIKFINSIKGYAINRNNDGEIEDYSVIVQTIVKRGKQHQSLSAFYDITTEEFNSLVTQGKVDLNDVEEHGNETFTFGQEDKTVYPMSAFYGCTIAGETLSKDCQLQVYNFIFAGFFNAHYVGHDENGDEVAKVRNEYTTLKGIRCFFDTEGNMQPLYLEQIVALSNEIEDDGTRIKSTTISEALNNFNEADEDGTEWFYHQNACIDLEALEDFYANVTIETEEGETFEGVTAPDLENFRDYVDNLEDKEYSFQAFDIEAFFNGELEAVEDETSEEEVQEEAPKYTAESLKDLKLKELEEIANQLKANGVTVKIQGKANVTKLKTAIIAATK